MLVRLLVVVLTLIGAVPVRICTCGAAHQHHSPAPAPKDDCGHDHHNSNEPSIAPDPLVHHDADCHAVKPRPIMSLGLQFNVTDIPPTDVLAVELVGSPMLVPIVGHEVRDFHPPPNRPLFLTFLVLRN